MSVVEQLTLAWQALLRTVADLRRAKLWPPLLLLGGLQLAVVGLLWWFAHPAVSWFMAPLLSALAGEEALRYPNVFRLMPGLFGRIDVVIGALAGSIAIGAATLLFASRYRGEATRPGEAIGEAWRRAAALIGANLPFNVLVVALSYGLEWWIAQRGSGVMVQRVAYGGILVGSVVLQSLFFYVTALVMLEQRGVRSALAALPLTWERGFWAALFVGMLLLLPLLPIHYLSGLSSMLVDRGKPELVGWMVLVQVGLGLVQWFLLAGASCVLYLSLIAEPAGGSRA